MKVLNTQFGGTLKAQDLNALGKAIMANSYNAGKGVVEGMEVTPGIGLNLNVAPGVFQAQVQDKLNAQASVPVPPDYDGYLWVEANSDDGDVPNFDHQGTDADYGTNWVCLGHFVSSASGVVYDDAGRKAYGWRSAQAVVPDVDAMIQAAVPKFRTDNSGNSMLGPIDGTNRSFTLSFPPIHGSLDLTVTGGDPGDYTLDGDTLIFDNAPAVGSTIKAQYAYV